MVCGGEGVPVDSGVCVNAWLRGCRERMESKESGGGGVRGGG